MKTESREVFIETEANDILKNCLYDHIRDGITKRKPLIFTEKAKDLFSLFANGVIIVNDIKNGLNLIKEPNSRF